MSDIMRPMSFAHLMNWVLSEYRDHGSVFGVPAEKMPKYPSGPALSLFSERLEAPYGPAAGPHTQLAQNLIAAYVSGCRFFELKTVQIMDGPELSKCVPKPCITALDEGYNCEWSTELTVEQAQAEYAKAWFACKLLARELDLGDPEGFIFNLSVGYDLAGIKSPKIDAFIEGMKDASALPVWQECLDWAGAHLDRFRQVDSAYISSISPKISHSITESTLHGCPPEEIERIAAYLLKEKGLHTFVKCNPTLLGYDYARKALDSLGFDYVTFDDHHFKEDLQMEDALPMLRRLQDLGQSLGLDFGVKLTNTFPVDVAAGELPSGEMYMSGRALYPLTLALAEKLTASFGGRLRISWSGGAEARNIRVLFDAGIWPITMATTVLKPGGYERFAQIGSVLGPCPSQPWSGVDGEALSALLSAVPGDPLFEKPLKPAPDKKLKEKVPLLDCFTAPCREGCPIHQDIPAYLALVDQGRYAEALEVILRRNPLPFTTGTICPHPCGGKCMRQGYDESIHIREAKLKAAREGVEALLPKLRPEGSAAGKKVAVIGGGPAGLAAAFYLGRAGAQVTLFEKRASLGGVVRHAIPPFRIPAQAVDQDVALVLSMGAQVRLNTPAPALHELREQGFTHILLAVGAWAPGTSPLKEGTCLDALRFLTAVKAGQPPEVGRSAAVIGGGNTAMDTARAVKRLPGVEKVYVVYRRDERNMPADEEELAQARADGVIFRPLLAPEKHENGMLTCRVMKLGELDASGRRSPVESGEELSFPVDTVIAAVGQRIEGDLLTAYGVPLDDRGRAAVDETLRAAPGVYVAGDARKGPSTVVEAIADALTVSQAILGTDAGADKFSAQNAALDLPALRAKRGVLCADRAQAGDPGLCLGCAALCETCVSVCPNRANVSVEVPGMDLPQIVHLDGLCNECGNCAQFCPYDSRPYRDKFTLFWSWEDFDHSENDGWLPAGDGTGRCAVRLGGQTAWYDVTDPACGLYDPLRRLILAVRDRYGYLIS